MASPNKRTISDSGSDVGHVNVGMDERKRKRMESNRISAQRSRLRKQKQVEELLGQVTQLQKANRELTVSINVTMQNYTEVESRNNVLRAQVIELTDHLRSLNSVLEIAEEVSGLALYIPEIPEPLMKWQVPVPVQSILANVDLSQY
ncbi:hypothetical protein SAY87_010520 [Trapa incisa]|uniref:BZIP domain-containing protein n=1 Tax=Trapa incisa TaxID=236973 RepID=A0AAN7GH79_9MYRT|nr:hypothetical protein SAY87_010520 [Trapa incisa]